MDSRRIARLALADNMPPRGLRCDGYIKVRALDAFSKWEDRNGLVNRYVEELRSNTVPAYVPAIIKDVERRLYLRDRLKVPPHFRSWRELGRGLCARRQITCTPEELEHMFDTQFHHHHLDQFKRRGRS